MKTQKKNGLFTWVIALALVCTLGFLGCPSPTSSNGDDIPDVPNIPDVQELLPDSTDSQPPVVVPPSAAPLWTSLDPLDPVYFYGDRIEYRGESITLGPKTIYIDGSLPDDLVSPNKPHVYNDFRKAADAFVDGSEIEPMTVLLAPWVYSIDDPEVEISGQYGMTINKTWLYWKGLTYRPGYVVICSFRGEDYGAPHTNYTNFSITGNGLHFEDITIANYCTVDLVYPLKPEFSRPKVTVAINTHAQLISYSGDKVIARRTRFVSRLNMFPIMGATRALYDSCHFECTDDSLTPNGVYVNCDFDLYGKFPFGGIGGAVLLNCKFKSHVGTEPNVKQYLSKSNQAGTIVDGEFVTDIPDLQVGWTRDATANLRGYQYNIILNGQPALISDDVPGITVRLEDYPDLLKAYRFTYGGEIIYNTFNLLRGNDDWDPMGIRYKAEAAGVANIPTRMTFTISPTTIETGTATNTATPASPTISKNPANTTGVGASAGAITWNIYSGGDAAAIDPGTGLVTANNTGYAPVSVVVEAVSAIGLHAAAIVTSRPTTRPAPSFTVSPSISLDAPAGKLKVEYTLGLDNAAYVDQSIINWYRCTDASGANPRLVAVSRLDIPEKEYTLTPGDAGYFIRAEVTPKHSVSLAGASAAAMYTNAIVTGDVKNGSVFHTNFRNFPTDIQTDILAGFWTLDQFRYPDGTQPLGSLVGASPTAPTQNMGNFTLGAGSYWNYGMGIGGGAVNGLRSGSSPGSRAVYTPTAGSYGNMSLTVVANPEKLEGQGFAGSPQGMDIFIKYDETTKSGYGIRINRIPAFSTAVVINLIKYENGNITYLTNEGSAQMAAASTGYSCYIGPSTIELKLVGTTLSGKVTTEANQTAAQNNLGFKHEFNKSVEVTPTAYGGINLYHFGNQGTDGRTILSDLTVQWQ